MQKIRRSARMNCPLILHDHTWVTGGCSRGSIILDSNAGLLTSAGPRHMSLSMSCVCDTILGFTRECAPELPERDLQLTELMSEES